VLLKPIVQAAGTDISHWFSARTQDVSTYNLVEICINILRTASVHNYRHNYHFQPSLIYEHISEFDVFLLLTLLALILTSLKSPSARWSFLPGLLFLVCQNNSLKDLNFKTSVTLDHSLLFVYRCNVCLPALIIAAKFGKGLSLIQTGP